MGLRNLTRALAFIGSAISLKYPLVKSIYDGLYTCFASHMDSANQKYVSDLILSLFCLDQIPTLPKSDATTPSADSSFVSLQGFILPKGPHPPSVSLTHFILTPSFQSLLTRLAAIVAVTDYAVILQGPTSAGKTATVQYLA